MLLLVVFMLLFNLTCITTLQNRERELDNNDSPKLASFGLENTKQEQNIHTNKILSANKGDSVLNDNAPAIHKLLSEPFEENDGSKQQRAQNNDEKYHHSNQGNVNNVQNPNREMSNPQLKETKDSRKSSSDNGDLSKQIKNDIPSENNNFGRSSTLKPFSPMKGDVMQSGALLRGFYVFLGLSVIVIAYFLFRSYRLRHGNPPSTTVRKYGITARRSDMEMRPLELDEDDDDTLFEIGNQSTNR